MLCFLQQGTSDFRSILKIRKKSVGGLHMAKYLFLFFNKNNLMVITGQIVCCLNTCRAPANDYNICLIHKPLLSGGWVFQAHQETLPTYQHTYPLDRT